MTKKLLFLVAVAGLIFTNNGCTSKKADDGEQVVENADIEKIEADGMGSPAADASLESALGETPTPSDSSASAAPTIDDSSLSLDTADIPPPTENAPDTPLPALDAAPPMITETPLPPTDATTVDTAALAASLGSSSTGTETVAPPADTGGYTGDVTTSKPATSSIKKVSATMPYQGKDGAWINTVYIARPKEKLVDISTKIFGTDKTKELKQIAENKFLKSRAPKAGDKIYYTSPNRPDDSAKTMLYYEDMGMVPEIYVAKKGESLKKVSKELLGYDNAWREVWASNGVESKTSLKDGETLRYWKSADSAMAAGSGAGTATLVDATQAPQPTAQIEPPAALPPPPTDANANLPPPPDPNAAATAGTDASAGLPPPPPADLAPPPPPPPDTASAEEAKPKINLDEAAAAEEATGELDSDTMMSMGALGVLVAMMAFVIIRKKKQKAQMMGEMNA